MASRPGALAALLSGIALLLLATSPAASEPDTPEVGAHPWRLPAGAIATFAADSPAPTSRQAWVLLSTGLRIALNSDVVGEGVRPAVQALLAAGQVGQGPYTIALLDLDVTPDEKDRPQVTDLRLVLELHTQSGHREAMKSLQAILAANGDDAEERRQEPLTLPGERRGVRYHVAGQPAWRTLEWSSHASGFTVALGAGTLARWFAAVDAEAGPDDAVRSHRAALRSAREAEGADLDERLVELHVDVDRLRAAAPALFRGAGIVPETLNALRLGYARSFMLHGWREGRMLLLDATYDTRLDPPGRPRRRRLTLARYPAKELRLPQPDGSFILAAEVNWPRAYEWLMRFGAAVTDENHRDEFVADRRAYEGRHADRLYSLLGAFKPYLVISDTPTPPLAIPGAATAYFELREGLAARRLDARLARLLEPFRVDDDKETWRDMHVGARGEAWDERVWFLQVDELGLIRYPAWGWAERWFVASWSIEAVGANRSWLAAPDGAGAGD